jgi:hypothetical protein
MFLSEILLEWFFKDLSDPPDSSVSMAIQQLSHHRRQISRKKAD